jgi:hypothetical protein
MALVSNQLKREKQKTKQMHEAMEQVKKEKFDFMNKMTSAQDNLDITMSTNQALKKEKNHLIGLNQRNIDLHHRKLMKTKDNDNKLQMYIEHLESTVYRYDHNPRIKEMKL